MTPRALKIAIVSPDRDSLRTVGWLLNAFGYETVSSVEFESVTGGLADHADMLILDADFPQLSLDKSPLLRRPEGRYIYTLLLSHPRKMPSVADAVEWGVDDFLQKPVNHGEVLARLRAGARFLEFEHRLEEQATRDALTGLLTQSGLLAAMRRASDAAGRTPSQAVLIATDLDHFSLVGQRYGREHAEEILLAVASALTDLAKATSHVARIGEDRFALFLANCKDKEGAALAEAIRGAVGSLPVEAKSGGLRLTASVAFTAYNAAEDVPLEVLDRANEALAHAKSSGRDCVVRAGEFDTPFAEWRRELNAGNPFASVKARDVMQPFGTFLRRNEDLQRERGQLMKSALEYFAVVDADNALVGTIHRDQLTAGAPGREGQDTTDSRLLVRMPFAVPEETPFGDLVERFTTEDDPLVVVLREREPRGFITREGFLNLIEPIHTGSFRPSTPFSPNTGYLVVPEFVKLDE